MESKGQISPLVPLGRNDITTLCLCTFCTTPIALMKTNNEVEPAEINGNGSPVGGIEPVTTSCFTINLNTKKRAYLLLFFCALLQV